MHGSTRASCSMLRQAVAIYVGEVENQPPDHGLSKVAAALQDAPEHLDLSKLSLSHFVDVVP